MARRILFLAAAAAGVAVFFWASSLDENVPSERVFHATLADPDLYVDGVYTDSFQVTPGEYMVRFVPSGDSPPTIFINMRGSTLSFDGTYTLQSTLHDTGISEYFTWSYDGPDRISITDEQSVMITVDPRGSTAGSVSVSLIKKQ